MAEGLTPRTGAAPPPSPRRCRRAAHSLKSNSSTFGATRLAELARTFELSGMPPGTAEVDALEAEYARTTAALQALAAQTGGPAHG